MSLNVAWLVGARLAGLSPSEAVGLMGFSHTVISLEFAENGLIKRLSSKQQFSVSARELLLTEENDKTADRKAAVTQVQ